MNTKEKAQKLADFYQELSTNDNGFTYNSTQIDTDSGPNLDTVNQCLKYFIVNPPKPAKKVIDLSMMVGSDILMEFQYEDRLSWHISKLGNIEKTLTNNSYFMSTRNGSTFKCRIMQDHWHHWNGGECPLPEGLNVLFEFTDKSTLKIIGYTNNRLWHRALVNCIIAFKVLGPADEWRYEWDEE